LILKFLVSFRTANLHTGGTRHFKAAKSSLTGSYTFIHADSVYLLVAAGSYHSLTRLSFVRPRINIAKVWRTGGGPLQSIIRRRAGRDCLVSVIISNSH